MHELRRLAQPFFDDPPVAPTSVAELRARARRRRNRRVATIGAALAVVVFAAGALVVEHAGSAKSSVIVGGGPTTTNAPTATTEKPNVAPLSGSAVIVSQMGLVAPGVGWAMNGVAVYGTEDDGAHWSDITPPGVYDPIANVDNLDFVDADHGWAEVVLNSGFTLYRTDDGGHVWQPACAGAGCGLVGSASAMTFLDTQRGWSLSSNGGDNNGTLYTTADAGTSWARVGETPFTGPIRFINAHDGWGVSEPNGANPPNFGGALYRTTDGGATWQAVHLSSQVSARYTVPQFFGDDGVVASYVPAHGSKSRTIITVYTTANGGKRWTPRVAPADPDRVPVQETPAYFLFSAPSSTDWMMLQGTRLDVTHDGGEHWSTITPTPPIPSEFGIAFASTTDGWALGTPSRSPALVHTTDGGKTWSLLSPHAPAPAASTFEPKIQATPNTGLTDGQRVTIEVTGFGVGGKVWLSECASAADVSDLGCGPQLPEQTLIVTGNNRSGSGSFMVRDRAATRGYRPTDLRPCTSTCVLVATLGVRGGYASTPITFGRT